MESLPFKVQPKSFFLFCVPYQGCGQFLLYTTRIELSYLYDLHPKEFISFQYFLVSLLYNVFSLEDFFKISCMCMGSTDTSLQIYIYDTFTGVSGNLLGLCWFKVCVCVSWTAHHFLFYILLF